MDDLVYVTIIVVLTAATGLLAVLCHSLMDTRGEKR